MWSWCRVVVEGCCPSGCHSREGGNRQNRESNNEFSAVSYKNSHTFFICCFAGVPRSKHLVCAVYRHGHASFRFYRSVLLGIVQTGFVSGIGCFCYRASDRYYCRNYYGHYCPSMDRSVSGYFETLCFPQRTVLFCLVAKFCSCLFYGYFLSVVHTVHHRRAVLFL